MINMKITLFLSRGNTNIGTHKSKTSVESVKLGKTSDSSTSLSLIDIVNPPPRVLDTVKEGYMITNFIHHFYLFEESLNTKV